MRTSSPARYRITARETVVNAVPSARPQIEAEFPWLKNLPKMTEGKLRAALESGKGVEYNRLVNEAGRHIQAAKTAAAPVIEEYKGQLERAAKDVEGIDADLARTLRDISTGKFSGISNLRAFVKDRLNDAEAASQFDKALGELSTEELREGIEEPSGEGPSPRETTAQKAIATIRKSPEFESTKTLQPKGFGEKATAESDKLADAIMSKGKDRNFAYGRAEEIQNVLDHPEKHDAADIEHAKALKEMWMGPERRIGARTGEENREEIMPPAPLPEGVLPGMESAVRENKTAAGKFQGEELTKAMRAAGKNISAQTGEMETKSPLFRGTEASPQREIFGQAPTAEPTTKQYDERAHNDREAVRNHENVSPNKYAQFVRQEEMLPRSAKDRAAFWKRVRENLK